jgi:hypothetical protein
MGLRVPPPNDLNSHPDRGLMHQPHHIDLSVLFVAPHLPCAGKIVTHGKARPVTNPDRRFAVGAFLVCLAPKRAHSFAEIIQHQIDVMIDTVRHDGRGAYGITPAAAKYSVATVTLVPIPVCRGPPWKIRSKPIG